MLVLIRTRYSFLVLSHSIPPHSIVPRCIVYIPYHLIPFSITLIRNSQHRNSIFLTSPIDLILSNIFFIQFHSVPSHTLIRHRHPPILLVFLSLTGHTVGASVGARFHRRLFGHGGRSCEDGPAGS